MASASAVPRLGRSLGWAQLNAAEREAAGTLGYDQAAWDAGLTPQPCCQSWKQLRRKTNQLHAAEVLGYTQAIWDAELAESLATEERP